MAFGRGRFGGSTGQQMLTVSVDVPINLRLQFDATRVTKRVGQRIAAKLRSALKKGQTYEGDAIPAGKDGGPPLMDTGRLIRSIKYRKQTQTIEPTGKREDVSRRAQGNFGLLMIHLQTREIDPLSTGESGKIYEDVAAATEKAIAKEIEGGKATLVGELRRVVGKKR